jgi:hypothetical protein
MISMMRNRVLTLVVTIYMIGFIASPAWAALIPSKTSLHNAAANAQVQQDIEKVQLALENKLVQEKLRANGLMPGEVKAKLSTMSPAQVHLLAQASDDVLAGGDGVGVVIGVLIIIILIIVILKLTNHEIIIKMSSLEDPASPRHAPVG